MAEKPVIVQKLQLKLDSPLERAIRYYTILFAMNKKFLPPLELKLLAFIAVKGTISAGGAKEQFCELFNTTKASVGNAVWKLGKKGLVITINGRHKVMDALQLDFKKDIILKINIIEDVKGEALPKS